MFCACKHSQCLQCFLPLYSQSKYREDGMKSLSQSFYSQLSETAETQFAKTVSELQSEVREQQLLIYLLF